MSIFSVAETKQSYQVSLFRDQWVEVLVDCPFSVSKSIDHRVKDNLTDLSKSSSSYYQAYTYRVPIDLTVEPGYIVLVPFGSQKLSGIVLGYVEQLPKELEADQIKDIEAVLSDSLLPSHYWELLNRVAHYYYTPLAQVVKSAFPPGVFKRSQTRIRLCIDKIPNGYEVFCSPQAQKLIQILKVSQDNNYSLSYLRNKLNPLLLKRAIAELTKREWVETYAELPRENKPKKQIFVSLVGKIFLEDLSQRQTEILQILKTQGGEQLVSDFLNLAKTTLPTLRKLEKMGYLTLEEREILRLEKGINPDRDVCKTLTAAQQKTLETIQKIQQFTEILVHGVTGSGKTEVYLQAIAPILAQGKSALVLVPEIGLTPQLTDRFCARFGDRVCVYHSGLSEGERYDTWRQLLMGTPQVIIGTRSAIFLPISNLGMIILDEEHDSSFKQTQPAPTYHARTVARWRAQLENCPLILGSATPSLETWVKTQSNLNHNCDQTYYLSLPERIESRPLPPVEIVDMRQELQRGNRSLFSVSLKNALEKLKNEQKQGILFINRRGHSTFVSCRSCGYVMDCPNCDVSLSYHYIAEGSPELLRCHYCNHTTLQPRHCPDCRSPYFRFFGSGTQKVTQALTREFPQLRWLRFDSDTTRTKGAHRQLLSQFAQGEADILVGTQMLTKGLDLAQVTLVGVIAADGLLYHSDYSASERAFQTLTQVAGRSGRGEDPGQVIIQTYHPEHPVIQSVKNHNYQSFIEQELPSREELGYPPYGHLILLRFTGLDSLEVQQTAEGIATACLAVIGSEHEILGPAPASIMRVAKRYRWQILLKFSELYTDKRPNLESLRSLCPSTVQMLIEVDPLSIQ